MAGWKLVTHEDPTNNIPCLITMSVIGDVIIVALFLKLKWSVVSPNWIRTRPWTVLFWCAMASIGMLVPSQWLQEVMPELPNWAEDMFEGLIANPWGYVVIGLMAPFVEELVMRGAVLRALLKWNENHWVGIAISAVLFALIHANPAQMPHAFLAGLLLPQLKAVGIDTTAGRAADAVAIIKERATFPKDLLDLTLYMFKAPETYDEKSVNKFWKEENVAYMRELREIIADLEIFEKESAEHLVREWIEAGQLPMGKIMNCLRIAIMGIGQGPDIFSICEFIGKEETLRRIDAALASLLVA